MRYLLILLASVLNAQLLTEIDNQILHLKGTTGVTVTGAGVSTWADQSGNAHDFSQTIDADRPDYVNNAYLDFDRSNTEYLLRNDDDHFSFGDGSSDEPWSISVYINMDDARNFDIMSKGEFNDNFEYQLRVDGNDWLRIHTADESVASCYIGRAYSTALTPYENEWIHIAGTYDGSGASSGFKLYLNGVQVDDADMENYPGLYVAMENLGGDVAIGYYGKVPHYADGKFQEIIWTNDVLTPAEISNLHTYFTTGTYPLDEQPKSDLFDIFNGFGGW